MKDYGQIRQMYIRDGKSIRQIAREMHISRNTVAKYCKGNALPGIRCEYHRTSAVITEEVTRFIQSCLDEDAKEPNKKQHHTAKRIYDRLVEETGFTGGASTVRRCVHLLRGNLQEAFVPLAHLPGDAMQIDWGEAVVYLKGVRTKVNFFCARLCYSCAPFVVCFRRKNTEALLEALRKALEFFGGVPAKVIFDNDRVAVKEKGGKEAIAQEKYEAFAAHYCFHTVFCNVRSGNEKGLVENLVGWVRRNVFVPVPRVDALDELNRLLLDKCKVYANTHKIPGRENPVKDLLLEDQKRLCPLPGSPFDASRAAVCRVTPFSVVRFVANDYSVPVKYVGQEVTVRAYAEQIRIFAKGELIAEHARNYGQNQQILKLAHYLPLLEYKPRSILEAKPVRQNLSAALLQFLETNAFSSEQLVEILRLCAADGENAFWEHKEQFMVSDRKAHILTDPVKVQQTDLSMYDQFLQEGGNMCRTQV